MKIIEDYLRKDLGRDDLVSWAQIREAYAEYAYNLVKSDWQSPSYLSSLESEAGRREGKIIGNINDYTRDQHDLSLTYEQKFSKEYLPRLGLLPIEPYVTSSGMAALSTIIFMLQREYGVEQTILVGKHSYFQNLELLHNSFAKIIIFDEDNELIWRKLLEKEQPLAIFVDSLCNEPSLTEPDIVAIAKTMKKGYLVVDNSMLSIRYDWKKLYKNKNRNVKLIGWESLNKYYEFGMDRVTGGVVWSHDITTRAKLSCARRHTGTIMNDISVAMLPTPNRVVMQKYLERIDENREVLEGAIGIKGKGAQIVVNFKKKKSYEAIQKLIKKIIMQAKKENLPIVAGTSFGMANTRIYLTAKQTEFTQMFLRISVGTHERDEMGKISRLIASMLVGV